MVEPRVRLERPLAGVERTGLFQDEAVVDHRFGVGDGRWSEGLSGEVRMRRDLAIGNEGVRVDFEHVVCGNADLGACDGGVCGDGKVGVVGEGDDCFVDDTVGREGGLVLDSQGNSGGAGTGLGWRFIKGEDGFYVDVAGEAGFHVRAVEGEGRSGAFLRLLDCWAFEYSV